MTKIQLQFSSYDEAIQRAFDDMSEMRVQIETLQENIMAQSHMLFMAFNIIHATELFSKHEISRFIDESVEKFSSCDTDNNIKNGFIESMKNMYSHLSSDGGATWAPSVIHGGRKDSEK